MIHITITKETATNKEMAELLKQIAAEIEDYETCDQELNWYLEGSENEMY